MAWIWIFIFIGATTAADSVKDDAILSQLRQGYAACEKGPSAEFPACRNRAYSSVARVYCRNQVSNCSQGFSLMDPKYCYYPHECKTQPDGSVELSYSAKPGETCQASTQRAELTDAYLAREGEAMEYSMDMTLPPAETLTAKNKSLVVAQFKASGGNSPPFALRYKSDGRLVATVRHNRGANGGISLVGHGEEANGHQVEQELIKKVVPGQPLKITMQFQAGAPGFVRVKVNGQVLWSYNGPMGYKDSPNYFKIGPYDHSCSQKDPIVIKYNNFQRGHIKEKIEPDVPPPAVTPDTAVEV